MRREGWLLILVAIILLLALVGGEVLFITGTAPSWNMSLALPALALVLGVATAAALLLRYRTLPQVKEKRALQSEQAQVQRQLEEVGAELEAVEQTRWPIQQQERVDLEQRRAAYDDQTAGFAWHRHMIDVEERDDVSAQLGRLQDWHVARGLASSPIFCAEIPRVGRTLKAQLAAEDIETAADVSYERVAAVHGFGRAKAKAVVSWREEIEQELEQDQPDRLPPELQAQVASQYDRRRADLAAEEQTAAADFEDDLQAIERSASEYYVRNDLREERARERLAVLERQNAALASQLSAYAIVSPTHYITALLGPHQGRPGFHHRLVRIVVPLVFVATLFCQGSTALRVLATRALQGEPLIAPLAAKATSTPETMLDSTHPAAPVATVTPARTRPATVTVSASAGASPASSDPSPVPASSSPTPSGEVETATEATGTEPATAAGSPGADLVLAFNPGPGAQARYLDASALLGAPDSGGKCCEGMAQLGRSGSILLAFTDNVIVDGPGADFWVRGEGTKDDWLTIEVSDDGALWYSYPRSAENSEELDLAEVGLQVARFVRLTDLQPSTPTGAEVDAVVALNSSAPPGDGPPSMPDAVARLHTVLRDGPGDSAEEAGTVTEGAALTVLGRSGPGQWVKVRTEWGEEGWCRAADLGLNVTLEDQPQLDS